MENELTAREDEPTSEKSLATQHWLTNKYIKAATSAATRKAYKSDIRHFERHGGKLPTNSQSVVNYLHSFADTLNPRTLMRRLTALKQWHVYQNFNDPTQHPIVHKTIAGISRLHGKPREKAHPLSVEELEIILDYLNKQDSLTFIRDRALLQIGFFGALRRSELVAIQHEHIQWEKNGIEILIPLSKTDQTHIGQYCVIPKGYETHCPVTTLKNWLDITEIKEGPIFRRIVKNHLGKHQLTPLAVTQILKKHAKAAGLVSIENLSSHSLRRGLATCAAKAGAPISAIMRAGRWKQVNTAMAYIEAQERFSDNAAKKVLDMNFKKKE